MKQQKQIMRDSEADNWYSRNVDALLNQQIEQDPVLNAIVQQQIKPRKVLEIGCSFGKRLAALKQYSECEVYGIDLSEQAIADGMQRYPGLNLQLASADSLPFADNSFDLVVIGFCLYLCDRSDLFKIAAEVDRVLDNQGYVVIIDFLPASPHRREYAHQPGMFSFKMDYATMFSWHPAYIHMNRNIITHGDLAQRIDPNERLAVDVMQKLTDSAFPLQKSSN